ncbi:hypothetical protein F511_03474 [Dorcoceras hygrometricum]|uniref:Uncharacterized protein n=1 Tax=Dorcoceras hygrometricum TaxID=472368 RepID=A0A2Z7DC87_9LAMI|nr:hypothetical protein F511_03474 [Dorcoceras hygrometricum]
MVALVKTFWTWGWSRWKVYGISGRIRENEREDQQVVVTAQHGWSAATSSPWLANGMSQGWSRWNRLDLGVVQPEGIRQWWPEKGERTRIPAGGRAACSMAGASTCSDHLSLVRSRFEAWSVTLEPPGHGGGPNGRDLAVVAGAGITNAKT